MWDYVSAIIGYDCGTSSLNITTVSLLDIDDCEVEDEEVMTASTNIFLLQTNKYNHATVLQCKVEIVRTVHHCGMFSHITMVDNAYMEYIHTVSKETCQVAHNHGTMRISNTIIDGLQPNTTTTRSITFAGSSSNDGQCSGAQYSDPFGSWQAVVVMGVVRISLRSMSARVKIDNSKIYLPSGYNYPLGAGYCADPEGGDSFWDPLPKTTYCNEKFFSLLYKGNAIKTVTKSDVLYTVTLQETSFTLTKQGVDEACGLSLFRTEHPKLFIIESTNNGMLVQNNVVALDTDNMDLFMYVNAKLVYVEHYIRSQMNTLYKDVLYHRCHLEREILRNSLAIASIMPDEFAFRFMKGPGYMAVLAGEVVHIVQCVPVEVKVQQLDQCYNRLPILRGNETAFLTPRTHIVVTQATEISCNSPLLQYYRLGSMWYKLMPRPVETLPPIQVRPKTKVTWNYQNPSHLATSGIYTEADLEKMRDRIMFPMENTAILNKIAQRVSGNGTQYGSPSMYNIFDEGSLQKLAENAWGKTWGRFVGFGTFSAGLIGLFMVIRLCKLVIDTIIHGYTLHLVYGWSLHLLGALWDSVTNLLVHLARSRPEDATTTNRDVEMGDSPSAPLKKEDPLYPHLAEGNKLPTKPNFV